MKTEGTKQPNIFPLPEHLGSGSIRVSGDSENPLFCLKDVCDVLGIGNPSMAAARLDDDEKVNLSLAEVDQTGGRGVWFITESGLYTILLRSDKPQAKPFRKWVTSEVLPQIRKTGAYSKKLTPCEMILVQAKQLVELEREQIRIAETADAALEGVCSLALAVHAVRKQAQAAFDRAESNHGYFSVMGWCNRINRKIDWNEASREGVRLSRICRQQGRTIGSVADPRFGKVNTYPQDILEQHLGCDGWID